MTTLQRAIAPAGSQRGAVRTVGPSIRRARCLSAGTETVGAPLFPASVSFFGFAESAGLVTGWIRVTRNTRLAGKRFTLARRLLAYESVASKASPGQAIFT